MSDPVYSIKALRWKKDKIGRVITATVPFGDYSITFVDYVDGAGNYIPLYRLRFCFQEYYDEGVIDCPSMENAKKKAEADWRRRVRKCLKLVKVTNE